MNEWREMLAGRQKKVNLLNSVSFSIELIFSVLLVHAEPNSFNGAFARFIGKQ